MNAPGAIRHLILLALLFTIAALPPRLGAEEPPAHKEQPSLDSLGDALPPDARLRLGTLRFRHPSTVVELALSPDEKTLVTIGTNELIAWNTATGKERWRANPREHGIELSAASYGIRALAFSPDSARLFTPGGANKIVAWRADDGQTETLALQADSFGLLNRLGGRRFGGKSIDVTPDGRKFALGDAHGLVVCDQTGKRLFAIGNKPIAPVQAGEMNRDRLTFGGHYSYGRFSPDGQVLVVVTSDAPKEMRLCDTDSGDELRKIPLKDRLVRLAFSPDGKQIAATERDSAVRQYAVDSGEEVWSYKIKLKNNAESYTSGIAYSPDGKTIAVGAPIGSDYRIDLLDASGELVGQLHGHTWKPWSLAFSSDSRMLYSSGWDGVVRRWDVESRQQLALPVGIRATPVTAAAPDGKTLAYVDDLGTIRLVEQQNGTPLRELALPGTQYSELVFSADSRYLAGGGTLNGDQVCVAVFDLKDGRVAHQWSWPRGNDPHSDVEALRFNNDGTKLAAAVFRQSEAFLWDLSDDYLITELKHRSIYGLSFSPDGKTLATAGWDKVVRFWDANTGDLQREYDVSEGRGDGGDLRMYTVCYAPRGSLMATAHLDGNVRIWNATDMTLLSEFSVQGRFIFGSIAFSPDGLWLATGSMDGNVALWEPLVGEKMFDVGRHQSYVYTVGFGQAGETLLTGGRDGSCYLWELPSVDDVPREDLNVLWRDLAGSDRLAAYRAMRVLSMMPEQTVELLAKMRPGRIGIDQTQGQEWIDNLRASDRETREAAREALIGAGSISIQPLTEALEKKWPDGRRDELKELLSRAQATAVAEKRALSLLAMLNTPKARLLLKGWASQDAGALGRAAAALQSKIE